MPLPYPGRHESYSSWDFRCKQWENDRASWNRELAARFTNWGGNNYRAVQGPGVYVTPLGTRLPALKVFPSRSKLPAALRFVERTGGVFLVRVQHGNPNVITSREDYVVVRHADLPPLSAECQVESVDRPDKVNGLWYWTRDRIDEVYSDDTH